MLQKQWTKKRTYSEHEKYIYNWVIESMKSFIGWIEEGEEAGFTASCVLVEEKNHQYFCSQSDCGTISSVIVSVSLASIVWKVSAKVSPLTMFTFPYLQVKIQYIFSTFFPTFLPFLFVDTLRSEGPSQKTQRGYDEEGWTWTGSENTLETRAARVKLKSRWVWTSSNNWKRPFPTSWQT